MYKMLTQVCAEFFVDCSTCEDGTDRSYRNVLT